MLTDDIYDDGCFSIYLDDLTDQGLPLSRVYILVDDEVTFALSALGPLIAFLQSRGIVLVDGVFSRRLSG